MDLKYLGLLLASPEKRFKHFITTAADTESVWMLYNADGYATIDIDDYVHLLVWSEKEYAHRYDPALEAEEIEVHEFCERCRSIRPEDQVRFMVFPTDANAYVIPANDLADALEEELSLLE